MTRREFLGKRDGGRLAEWDGKSTKWTIVERNPFVEVHASGGDGSYGGNTLYAVGWTKSSVVLRALVKGQWQRYLLPEASHTWDHAWNTEWTRIRHAVTERLLMDAHGMFYELPAFAYGGHIWGIRPICSHLRVMPDFCYWRGMFVLASDQIDHDQGQPQSGLWFGNIDDLWRMGKPAGWGGPWWNTPVKAGAVSDPFLMTGFDKKVVHLTHDGKQPVPFRYRSRFPGRWQLAVVPILRGYPRAELRPSRVSGRIFRALGPREGGQGLPRHSIFHLQLTGRDNRELQTMKELCYGTRGREA